MSHPVIPPPWRVVDDGRGGVRYEACRGGTWVPVEYYPGKRFTENRCYASVNFAQLREASALLDSESEPTLAEEQRAQADAALDRWVLSIAPMKPCSVPARACVPSEPVFIRCQA